MSLSPAAVAGIVAGSIVALVLLFVLFLVLFRAWMRGPTKGSDNPKRLDGKVVVITGGNAGIGKETAEDIYRRGARTIILCRSLERGEKAIEDIKRSVVEKLAGGDGGTWAKNRDMGSLEVRQLDLASLASVRTCAEDLLTTLDKIDILINNAGVAFCPQVKTEDGFDQTFGTNHFGPFLLTELITPLLKNAASKDASCRPRIVFVSSMVHRQGQGIKWDDINYDGPDFDTWDTYAASKLANILHAKELARRLQPMGINVYSLHPGLIGTDLFRNLSGKWYYKCCAPPMRWIIKTPFHGAQTSLYCALDDSLESKTGGYYSDCSETTPASRALAEEDQKRLWRISVKAVGLPSEQD